MMDSVSCLPQVLENLTICLYRRARYNLRPYNDAAPGCQFAADFHTSNSHLLIGL